MLQKFIMHLTGGAESAPSPSLFQELRKADTYCLYLTSKKSDLGKLRSTFWGVNSDHTIMAELTWRIARLEEFGVYGTGRTSDEAIAHALAVFYSVFPSEKIQGETDNV